MRILTEVHRYRFVLTNLVAKNFKVLYRNMALGLYWSILNPLVMVVVLSVVWVLFFDAGEAFPTFVLVALIPFNFFSYCMAGCTQSVIENASLVKKVAFPREILPISVIITHLFHLVVQIPLLLGVMLLFPPPDAAWGAHLLWLPVVLLVHLVLVTSLGLLVSSVNVVYRDVRYIVESLLVVLFWVSPILYDAFDVLAERPLWMLVAYYLNPLSGILEGFRSVLFHGTAPHLGTLGVSAALTLGLGILGLLSFRRHERDFANLL